MSTDIVGAIKSWNRPESLELSDIAGPPRTVRKRTPSPPAKPRLSKDFKRLPGPGDIQSTNWSTLPASNGRVERSRREIRRDCRSIDGTIVKEAKLTAEWVIQFDCEVRLRARRRFREPKSQMLPQISDLRRRCVLFGGLNVFYFDRKFSGRDPSARGPIPSPRASIFPLPWLVIPPPVRVVPGIPAPRNQQAVAPFTAHDYICTPQRDSVIKDVVETDLFYDGGHWSIAHHLSSGGVAVRNDQYALRDSSTGGEGR